jgi:predicted nucleotidyltransferase
VIEPLRAHKTEIEALCRRYWVRRLEVFGSAADPVRFKDETSDLDFLVEFHPMPIEKYADAYFGLLDGLEALFGRQVDLVMPEAIRNRYFLEKVNQSREEVYAA